MATGIRINYIRIPAVCFWMHIVLVSIRFYAKVQKCAEYVFSEYSSLDKLYNKTILPILNGEVSLPDVGYTTAKNYDDEDNLTGETAEAEPTPYQKTANCKNIKQTWLVWIDVTKWKSHYSSKILRYYSHWLRLVFM